MLRAFFFGGLHVVFDKGATQPHLRPLCRGVLAFLLLNRRRVFPREVLAEVFWKDGDPHRTRKDLNTVLWRLRSVLEPLGGSREAYLVTTPGGDVGFNAGSDYWLDVEVFESRLAPFLVRPIGHRRSLELLDVEDALALYKGDLLDGVYYDWALAERERLRLMYLDGLAHLMAYYEHHRMLDDGLRCGRRILELDPLREEVHVALMRLYYANGQRTLALRQFEACRVALAAELDIAPMPSTQSLYARIARGEPLDPPGAEVARPALDDTLARLEHVEHELHGHGLDLLEAARLLRGSA